MKKCICYKIVLFVIFFLLVKYLLEGLMMSINNIRRYGSVLVATLGAGLLFMSNTAVHADSAVTNVCY